MSVIFICKNCVNDNRLKHLIESQGKLNNCSCCSEESKVIDVDSNEFIQMIKALIRYYFSEWDYNTHIGGVHYWELFDSENNIFFKKSRFKDLEAFEEIIELISSIEVYEDYEKGVSIFAGYYNGEMNSPLLAIKTDLEDSIVKFKEKLMYINYFQLEDEMKSILGEFSYCSEFKIEKGKSIYRSRTGYKDKKLSLFTMGWEGEMVFVPYSNSDVSAPPPHLAIGGRTNRHGVSYLYCATDKHTAISEIRPHPGDIVSVGKFILKRDVKIFDLSDRQFLNFYLSDKKLNEYKKLNTLSELMHEAIPPSQRQHYSVTQLISDCIRQIGYDGIIFNSSVGSGYNLVLFNAQIAEYTFDEAEVVEIKKVDYNYESKKTAHNVTEIDKID